MCGPERCSAAQYMAPFSHRPAKRPRNASRRRKLEVKCTSPKKACEGQNSDQVRRWADLQYGLSLSTLVRPGWPSKDFISRQQYGGTWLQWEKSGTMRPDAVSCLSLMLSSQIKEGSEYSSCLEGRRKEEEHGQKSNEHALDSGCPCIDMLLSPRE